MFKKNSSFIFALMGILFFSTPVFAQEKVVIKLPDFRITGGKPLMEALKERKTQRDFSSKELPIQVIADLLWAANGINRPDSGHRTAPSAMNMQEIDIYLVKADGVYLYNAGDSQLEQVLKEDIRALTGKQPFVKEAPLNLIFVADLEKMKTSGKDSIFYAATDTGFISQNVYLYCASEGFATVVRGLIDKKALHNAIGLRPKQEIILAQTVGYPKEEK